VRLGKHGFAPGRSLRLPKERSLVLFPRLTALSTSDLRFAMENGSAASRRLHGGPGVAIASR
jgi:hypothetical protein